MESADHVTHSLDRQFDQHLVEMKPYVMRLPHKTDRQRCAMWIKKFCEPPTSGVTGRKNRNMHADILLHMLKKGTLEGIFTQRPESGPLPSLPAYMSIYYEDLHQGGKDKRLPDWVTGELGSEASGLSGLLVESPAPVVRSFEEVRERFNDAVRRSPRGLRSEPMFGGARDRTPSPPRVTSLRDERVPPLHLEDFVSRSSKPRNLFPDDDDSTTTNGDLDIDFTRPKMKLTTQQRLDSIDDDWRNPSFGSTFLRDSTFRNNSSVNDRESEMKSKMVEARFQEEKLRLQQKHDTNVQKILERKNRELEDLKLHYRTKSKEHESTVAKLEKKVSQLQKELSHVRDSADQQLSELRAHADDKTSRTQTELEKKLQDTVAQFEQEKFELQKQHTRNIQELLDDTNSRLHTMETEYSDQITNTTSVTRELEARLQQLSADADSLNQAKVQLEADKAQLQERCDRLQGELIDYQARYTAVEKELGRLREDFEQEARSLKNKHEANMEFIKQEHNNHASKASDTISELEQHISQLKQGLEKSEQEKAKTVRELEEQHYQEKIHLEHLHEKKVKSLQQEIEQLEEDSQKRLRKLEESLSEKEAEVRRVKRVHEERGVQAEKALDTFKQEVQRNSAKVYDDMKKQMDKVESDLNRSKQLREKQAREFERQLQEHQLRHDHQIAEVKASHDREKSRLISSYQADKEAWEIEREHELDAHRKSMRQEIGHVEALANDRQERDAQKLKELDEQTHALREEVVQANQLRKEQLVELGLLREEEKQKMVRDHEQEMAKLKSEGEQERLLLEKKHGAEMETVLEKTNAQLGDIEKEYTARNQRSVQSMGELQRTIDQMKDDMHRLQEEAESRSAQLKHKYDDERKKLKQQSAHALAAVQQEAEAQKGRVRQLERTVAAQDQEHEEKMTAVRGQYEEKMRGYVTLSVRQELEDTIASLKCQVNSLQQRCAILQDEIDYRGPKYIPPLPASFSNTIDSSATLKSPQSTNRENL